MLERASENNDSAPAPEPAGAVVATRFARDATEFATRSTGIEGAQR